MFMQLKYNTAKKGRGKQGDLQIYGRLDVGRNVLKSRNRNFQGSGKDKIMQKKYSSDDFMLKILDLILKCL